MILRVPSKEAREIIHDFEHLPFSVMPGCKQPSHGSVCWAKGYLEAIEKAKPIIEMVKMCNSDEDGELWLDLKWDKALAELEKEK